MKARNRKSGAVKPGIPGDQVMKEAVAPAHGFKRGGKVKDGGIAEGMKSGGRLDKAPRQTLRGRSPMSSASKISPAG